MGERRRGNKRKEGERSRENEDGVMCVDRWGTYGHITNTILLANFTKMPSLQNTLLFFFFFTEHYKIRAYIISYYI